MQDYEPDQAFRKADPCEQGASQARGVQGLLLTGLCIQASYDKKQLDVGANLFIGNLDPMVDDTMLYNTFSTFGPITTTAKVGIPLSPSVQQCSPP